MESRLRHILVVLTVTVAIANPAVWAACCTAPDNGGGTVDFPSTYCPYDHPEQKMMIIDGLPPGTTIEIAGPWQEFSNIVRVPGGPLGGEVATFTARLVMNMTGTGGLAGFHRDILMPIQCEMHIGPRRPGEPVQSFDTDMFRLQGQLPPGDPDFDLLRITAGNGFGMPSPGHTTLTKLPDGNWAVDSFFDITYRIDFVGSPGRPLGGMSGSTTATIRMSTCTTGSAGEVCLDVDCSGAQYDANENPIPAGFFDPGSEPFDGVIYLGGGDPVGPDVIVRRLETLDFPGPLPSTDVVPIELVQLNLVSCEPIIVTYPRGQNPQLWDVKVMLQPSPPSHGQMTVTKTHANGGTFTSEFYVQPVFTFTKVGGTDVRVLSTGPIQLVSTGPVIWQDTPPKPNQPCDGQGFYPACSEIMVMSDALGEFGLELLATCRTVEKEIAVDGLAWKSALGTTVQPVTSPEWGEYMMQWQQYLQEGNAYPAHQYWEPELYVWDGGCTPCPNDIWPSRPGLVMVWGDPQVREGSHSSAWKYRYPDDPDLSNVTIAVTVLPPCGMNVVSFGLRDINGNIRAWYWNVAAAAGPGTLQCGVPTLVTVNTALTGVGAANPPAASYVNNPLFDIKQVQDLLVDENWNWVGGPQPVPPPGQVVPRTWNYWYDLIVTPNPSVKLTDPVKWSQPPVEICPGVILGWDERSVRPYRPLMADDWLCEDSRPVTDIHWWGSHLRWPKSTLPPQKPIAFHFGIWTDVPKDPTTPFSHPGRLVWEYICKEYQWNFAGYDKDPRRKASPVNPATDAVIQPTINDSCFQFYCKLPQNAWFYQKPRPNGKGRVYWLSIAAIYPAGTKPLHPWGWKTRPRYFNDDAVRIFQIAGGIWPPTIGASWLSGKPVEYPAQISWDLAFELTTNKPEPQVPFLDGDLNGIVDLRDLAILASQWLTVEQ